TNIVCSHIKTAPLRTSPVANTIAPRMKKERYDVRLKMTICRRACTDVKTQREVRCTDVRTDGRQSRSKTGVANQVGASGM
ncbi:MAG: hypothetical protein LUF04_02590, partial [Bacteroides sp.]|nr:hypothetical protein [Bacteroides sp.]